jgi:hypothetical protein
MDAPHSCCFLVTYTPLVWTRHGRDASDRLGLAPFIDGSIRREPDLEHEFPSISCLCRKAKFAPRLRRNNIVGYITRKARYDDAIRSHHRLTAVLKVIHICESHLEAAEWYRANGLRLPSNCMVEGNPPQPLNASHRKHKFGHRSDDSVLFLWNHEYEQRAMNHSTFVICQAMFRDLSWDSPDFDETQIHEAFGRTVGTQNPGQVDSQQFMKLLDLVGVELPPSDP